MPAARKKPAAKKKAAPKKPAVQKTATTDQSDESYRQKHQPLRAAGLDQHGAEAQRQAELAAERREHNARTGDPSVA